MRHLRGRARFETMVRLRTFATGSLTLPWLQVGCGFSALSRYSGTSSFVFFNSRLSHNHTTSFNTSTYFLLHKILTATNVLREDQVDHQRTVQTQHPPKIQKCASAIRETKSKFLHLDQYPSPVHTLSPRPARGLKRRRKLSVQRQSALNASQAPQRVIETRLKQIQRLRAHTGRLSACHSSTEQYVEASVAGQAMHVVLAVVVIAAQMGSIVGGLTHFFVTISRQRRRACPTHQKKWSW